MKKKVVDKDLFEECCRLGYNAASITKKFNIATEKLYKWVGENYKDKDGNPRKFRSVRNSFQEANIKMAQIQCALGKSGTGVDGNATMLVWLGKNVCGQKDKHEVEITDNTYADLLSEAEARTSDSD